LDKNKTDNSTGLNDLNSDCKNEFLRLLWEGATDSMCLAKMTFDYSGSPMDMRLQA